MSDKTIQHIITDLIAENEGWKHRYTDAFDLAAKIAYRLKINPDEDSDILCPVEPLVMQKIAVDNDIKIAIDNYYELTHNILECECDEYYGITCGLHRHQDLSRTAKEKLSNFSA